MQWQRIHIYRDKIPIGIQGVTGDSLKGHLQKASSQKDAEKIAELKKELQKKDELIKELQREIKDDQNKGNPLREPLKKLKE